jgi:isoleucyl-tRNA synthetase
MVEEPSIYIKFKLKDEDSYFLAWTTTPWTLISNVALAVNPKESYIKIKYHGESLIIAEERASVLLKGQEYEIIDGFSGKDLEYKEYEPLFNYETPDKKSWFVICADFVTMEDGTGIVHIAPAFGEDDYNIGLKYDLPVIQLVNLDGTFKENVTHWKGEFVKDADPSIIAYLEKKGLLEGTKEYSHEYPFCWRCDSPLLYYAMESWFIGMSKVQKNLVDNNNKVNWYPRHLQQGRFGDFIREVKDWALSRDRYWGTPLPVWTCSNKKCKHQICIGSVDELKKLSENFTDNYDLHKPFVDELIIHCSKCNSTMKRENEVIDCWYDSGSSFFAQWHYPFENKEEFENNFPIDFISEALDQTRGWFYSLLAISTFLFEKPCYKNVLTLGLVLDKDNQKMSKSKRNYVDPSIILNHEGADALRWYLLSANAPWNSTRFYEQVVKDTLGKFILTFWNSYNFFTTYASLDKFDPKKDLIPFDERELLDKWILSRFNKTIEEVRNYFETFETHKAARSIEGFLIDDFSNWYLRRSRKRLWVEEKTSDKLAGYSTMYDIFIGLSKILAPFIPFITEEIYQNLKTDDMPESIHLCDYLNSVKKNIDDKLEKGMKIIRDLVEAGRALRSKVGIKVRIPLYSATIVCSEEVEVLIKDLLDLINEEINVKQINFARDTSNFMIKKVKPNHSQLGPKYKEKAKLILEQIEKFDDIKLYQNLIKNKSVDVKIDNEEIKLSMDDFEIIEIEKEDIASTKIEDITLFIDTTLTPELEAEGFAREIVRRIQSMRKELDLDVEQHIFTTINISKDKQNLLQNWISYIKEETRSDSFDYVEKPTGKLVKTWNIDDISIDIGINI